MSDLDMTIEFHYSYVLAGKTVDEAYDKIVEWLNIEGSRIIVTRRSVTIEAMHGTAKALMSWKRNGKKKLRFSIISTVNGAMVKVTVTPTTVNLGEVTRMAVDAKLNWGALLEECWAFVEGVDETEGGKRIAEEKKELVATNRAMGRKMLLYGVAGLAIVFVGGVALVSTTNGFVPSVVVVIPSVMFGLTAFWGIIRMRSGQESP